MLGGCLFKLTIYFSVNWCTWLFSIVGHVKRLDKVAVTLTAELFSLGHDNIKMSNYVNVLDGKRANAPYLTCADIRVLALTE